MSEEELEFHDAIDEVISDEEELVDDVGVEELAEKVLIEPFTPTKQLEAAFQNLSLTSPPQILENEDLGDLVVDNEPKVVDNEDIINTVDEDLIDDSVVQKSECPNDIFELVREKEQEVEKLSEKEESLESNKEEESEKDNDMNQNKNNEKEEMFVFVKEEEKEELEMEKNVDKESQKEDILEFDKEEEKEIDKDKDQHKDSEKEDIFEFDKEEHFKHGESVKKNSEHEEKNDINEGWLEDEINIIDVDSSEEVNDKQNEVVSFESSMEISNSFRNSRDDLTSISKLSFEEMRSKSKSIELAEQPEETSSGYSWGGVLSVFGGFKEKATSHLNKLCDSFDPNAANIQNEHVDQEKEEDGKELKEDLSTEDNSSKSFKSIFDKLSLSPKASEEETKGGSGWFQGFDRTFDVASDKIGQALIGGIKRLENTMGVGIEPISSSSSIIESDGELSRESGSSNKNIEDSSSPVVGESSLGRNLYTAGLSTLEKIGRTTANIVVNTKERLVPIIDQTTLDLFSLKPSESQKIDRAELKKPFLELFDEFSGNIALEKLQLASSEASIALKTKLKSLSPAQMKVQQAKLKQVGGQLILAEENVENVKSFDLGNMDLYSEESQGIVMRMIRGIESSCELLNNMNEAIDGLRDRVDSPLPVDNPSLTLYFSRYHLAKVTAASLYLIVEFNYNVYGESDLLHIYLTLREKFALFKNIDLQAFVEDKRREALGRLICADAECGEKILADALQLTIPNLKYAYFKNL